MTDDYKKPRVIEHARLLDITIGPNGMGEMTVVTDDGKTISMEVPIRITHNSTPVMPGKHGPDGLPREDP